MKKPANCSPISCIVDQAAAPVRILPTNIRAVLTSTCGSKSTALWRCPRGRLRAARADTALIGLAIGLVASLALGRLMSSLLFGLSATDPLTFSLISLLLASVALLSFWIPSRRATKVLSKFKKLTVEPRGTMLAEDISAGIDQ